MKVEFVFNLASGSGLDSFNQFRFLFENMMYSIDTVTNCYLFDSSLARFRQVVQLLPSWLARRAYKYTNKLVQLIRNKERNLQGCLVLIFQLANKLEINIVLWGFDSGIIRFEGRYAFAVVLKNESENRLRGLDLNSSWGSDSSCAGKRELRDFAS